MLNHSSIQNFNFSHFAVINLEMKYEVSGDKGSNLTAFLDLGQALT